MLVKVPKKVVLLSGKALGNIAYLVDARHRRIVWRNLRFAMPELTIHQIREISRKVFQNAAISLLEIIQMAALSPEDILRRVKVLGEENLLAARGGRNGAIVISAHFGNWEMGHIFGSCYLREPLVLVARKIRPKLVNTWLERLRSRFGSEILDKGSALPKMIRALRKGRILGILIDQGTLLSDGIEIRFFGKTTNATPAAAILARRYQCPVVPIFCVRKEDGTLEMQVLKPLSLQKTENYEQDIQANTQKMMDCIENTIREHPEQWFWFHKRWKRHHPYLYPEEIIRRKKKKMRKKMRQERLKQ